MARKKTTSSGGSPKVLKLPIATCLTVRDGRAFKDLKHIAKQVSLMKNRAIRYWERWREDHPDYEPSEQAIRKDGSEWKTKKGEPLPDFAAAPRWMESEFYPICRQRCPDVASAISATVGNRIAAYLMGGKGSSKGKGQKVPYTHREGTGFVAHYCYEAILLNEIGKPSYKPSDIPIRSSSIWLGYRGTVSKRVTKSKAGQRFRKLAKDHFVISVPLFSDVSGRSVTRYEFLLKVGKLSKGQKKLLHKIVSGEIAMSDSSIMCKDGKFTFNLCWKRVQVTDESLESDRVAVLQPRPAIKTDKSERYNDFYAFELDLPEEDNEGRYFKGMYNIQPYLQESQFTQAREKAIRRKRKVFGPKGHGRKHFYKSIKPLRISRNNVRDQQFKLFITDVVRAAAQDKCGVLEYREPTKPTRDAREILFNVHSLTFNWCDIPAQLRAKCEEYGIEFRCFGEKEDEKKVERLNLDDWNKLVKQVKLRRESKKSRKTSS